MSKVPDFTPAEREVVAQVVRERYRKDVDVQVADAEIRMYPDDRELTEVPVLYWSERGCQFVIFKVAEGRYRSQFFYSVREQYGTGRAEYDDLLDCAVTLLRVQADHEAQRAGH